MASVQNLTGNSDDDDDLQSSPLPTITERLSQLRPSKELLEYYRKKISEYDNEHEEMTVRLATYKCTYEEQHKLQWELRQREEEISELQKALSDMQVYLFQEREQVLRLYAENDRLKIQELDDRKKIQHLLSLTRPTETEITYFIKGHPTNVIGSDKRKPTKEGGRSNSPIQGHRDRAEMKDRGPGGHHAGNKKPAATKKIADKKLTEENTHLKSTQQTLLLQIESLQAQLEEQTKHSNEEIAALMEDRKVRMEEQASQRERDSDKIKSLEEHLVKAQQLLYDSTKDFLEVKYDCRLKERNWMGERDVIMQELDFLKDQLNLSKQELDLQNPLHVHAGTQMFDISGQQTTADGSPVALRATSNMIINQMRNNLEQAQAMAEMYREQVIGLEDELGRIREENDCGKDVFKERTEKLTKRLKLMNQRYEALEKRRGLEVEGFKNDIKMLRGRLKEVEQQLYKVTVNIGDQFDWEILKNVHRTANRSKKLAGDLHHLKSKVYGLENDLKHL